MVKVKICGITRAEDLYVSAAAGANFVGFVVDVPSSPRNLTINEAKELIAAAPSSVTKVVVTVFRSVKRLLGIYDRLEPDFMQVHLLPQNLKQDRETIGEIPIIKAISVSQSLNLKELLQDAKAFKAILVDSHVPGKYGGTGITHDWRISRRIRDLIYPKPLILAGGLRPENVCEAILTVRPFAVDVSSGVESKPGIKDQQKIVSFIREVKRAELLLSYSLQ
ncbi:MAG: phosphoribosylanthranilate isomerase [Candidatus Bathyarchaeia archaeon]|nr:phosphoribosylanthranilate isomerase [Candidatus Bathyarchaeota archaeon]